MGLATEKGTFISFEGIEGSGKTTQAALLAEKLGQTQHQVVLTREPGGTIIGDRIREILLHTEHRAMSSLTELLLYFAARTQHLHEKILPALRKGSVVITDRFTDSTVAYQGFGRGIDLSLIASLDSIATNSFTPDLSFLLDIDVETGLKRNRSVQKIDRIELEDLHFHERVREGFLNLAQRSPKRFVTINGSLAPVATADAIWDVVRQRLLL